MAAAPSLALSKTAADMGPSAFEWLMALVAAVEGNTVMASAARPRSRTDKEPKGSHDKLQTADRRDLVNPGLLPIN